MLGLVAGVTYALEEAHGVRVQVIGDDFAEVEGLMVHEKVEKDEAGRIAVMQPLHLAVDRLHGAGVKVGDELLHQLLGAKVRVLRKLERDLDVARLRALDDNVGEVLEDLRVVDFEEVAQNGMVFDLAARPEYDT